MAAILIFSAISLGAIIGWYATRKCISICQDRELRSVYYTDEVSEVLRWIEHKSALGDREFHVPCRLKSATIVALQERGFRVASSPILDWCDSIYWD